MGSCWYGSDSYWDFIFMGIVVLTLCYCAVVYGIVMNAYWKTLRRSTETGAYGNASGMSV